MSHRFEYDENGVFFGYFCISLLTFFLILITYFLIKRFLTEKRTHILVRKYCKCSECQHKLLSLSQTQTKTRTKVAIIVLLISLWCGFFRIAYKIKTHEYTPSKVAFDPFAILGVDLAASKDEIKAAYRKLVVKKHPDHGGDMEEYISLTKAYKALTDKESRENYEKYGNPDGPQSMSFGIALPSWIIDKKYSRVVLMIYFIIFILGVPTAIGIWWYRSQEYYSDKLLVTTLQIYSYFFRKSSDIKWKTILTVICSSSELSPSYASFMKISSNEAKDLQKLATRLNVKPKTEGIFNQPSSMKARVLLFSHLSRIQLPDYLRSNLDPFLIKFVGLLAELQKLSYVFHYYKLVGKIQHGPSLETVLTCLRLSSSVVQGLQVSDSPLLQLPHFTDTTVNQIQRRKKSVNSIHSFLELSEKDRNMFLKEFSEFEKSDIFFAIESMPVLSIISEILVGDEVDPPSIELYSSAVVRFRITRKSLISVLNNNCLNDESTDINEEYQTHCPLFPHHKKEGWWVLLVNSNQEIIAGPLYFQLTNSLQCVDLPITIFGNPGTQRIKYIIISDTYKDDEYHKELSFNVTKPIIVEQVEHPQWETISEESDADEEVLTDTEDPALAIQ